MTGLISGAAQAEPVTGARWEYRPLLVFAADAAAAGRQDALLAADRDLVRDLRLAVYLVVGDTVAPRFGAPAPQLDAAALRRRFGVDAGSFRVVLVGLDGGAKLTSGTPLALDSLAGTINRMPMRRQELRSRGDG